ncbi:unnamed protein product [Ranitomeya imitator]|uniref:Helix-turn-helix domain-containing protein n=1 Tax=Ranitomeya imitator TaxID=111125 RepID=A0ABN9LUT0_9NEOB|nr:unnamed protein product [Ranitomeya imitator]
MRMRPPFWKMAAPREKTDGWTPGDRGTVYCTLHGKQLRTRSGKNMRNRYGFKCSARAYANLYMDRFERDFVYPNTLFQQHALLWYRYIDDIFCIWQGDHTSLTAFHNTINEIRPELKFSISHHMEAITFLDTKICKDVHGSLTTDIYTKPTDRNNLLLYNSCHPKSTRNSLPRSQFKRVSRIVSNPTIRQSRLSKMSKKFEDREYPCTLLNTEMTKILSETDPTSIPLPKPSRLPFVHGHHPSMQRVHNLIHKQWPLLTKAYPRIAIFKKSPPDVPTQTTKHQG